MKTFKINNHVEVYKDSFENGEGDHVSGWQHSATVAAETPMAAIQNFFDKELYFSFNEENANVYVEDNGKNVLFYSTLVDQDNCEVSQTSGDYENFKNGKIDLFVAHSRITIFELVPAALPNINN